MKRTCLQHQSRLVSPMTDNGAALSGIGRALKKISQEFRLPPCFLRLGLIGLMIWASAANSCLAGRSETGAQGTERAGAQTSALPRGIRDPLNPQAYMTDLANRLSSAKQRKTLLRGVNAPTSPQTPLEAPTMQETTVPQPSVQGSTMQEADLRRLIAEELERQRQIEQQAAAQRAQDLRRLIAEEVSRYRQSLTSPDTGSPSLQEPAASVPVSTEQDLHALIAQELIRQGLPVPQVDGQEATVQQPTTQEPNVPEPDLPTLIAQELQRRRQGAAQPNVQEPSIPEPNAPEPDLATLIAQELQRRRQRAAQERQQESDPLLAGAAPTTSGMSPLTGLAPDNRAALRAYRDIQARNGLAHSDEEWSLAGDLDKYRAHAVAEGSRNSGESLKKALKRVGLTLEDSTNIFTLGYASDRGKPFRLNDGKGLFQEPGNVPKQAAKTIVSFGDGLYSLVDLATFDMLSDKKKNAYQDNNPLVRPLVFTGKTIGGVWKTTEELGNAITWGYFDNVTGAIGLCFEDIIEVLKHTGQAVTNIVRAPLRLIGGKDEKADKALDWILLVPLEFASNAIEMKGIANMDDYETAFADKGVIGSILEFGGSTFIVYRAIDEALDQLDDDNGKQTAKTTEAETPTEPTPTEPTIPDVVTEPPVDAWLWFDDLYPPGE